VNAPRPWESPTFRCEEEVKLQACQDAVGTGLGVMMIFFLWAVTDGILLMLRLVFRKKERATA